MAIRVTREALRRAVGPLLLSAGASGALVTGAAAQETGQLQVTATVPEVVIGLDRTAGRPPSPGPVPHVVVDTVSAAGTPIRVRITIFFE
jgi:hypothetical protein